ncbi:MAG: TM0106 family RecB-like putative nuclease, partial [Gammaproteobacteria bacterium]
LDAALFSRLRGQAALQSARRRDGENRHEPLALDPEQRRGFYRLPKPDPGDIFFDMEGDPLEPGGLEYLFGVYYQDNGATRYRCFWAHDRMAERRAFEAFIDFVGERLRMFPGLHIYHYAPYEATALKRLMSMHGTREAAVDDLLRRGRLVDLYKVVREALRVSEPRYSIKNLETFYMGKRSGEVKDAGASMVFYEHWRLTSDQKYLGDIQAYNEDDCRSTYLLREWLLKLRPADLPWLHDHEPDENGVVRAQPTEDEEELEHYRKLLLEDPTIQLQAESPVRSLRELTFHMLDFHRRCAKPEWWAMFARQEMTVDELIDDAECLGGLTEHPDYPLTRAARSAIYTYRFPEQESKLKKGDTCRRSDTLKVAGEIVELDEAASIVRIRGTGKEPLPPSLSLIPQGPIDTRGLRSALYRVADSVIAGDERYQAIKSLLLKQPPRVSGHAAGQPLIGERGPLLEAAIRVTADLDQSYLFIQGPPGAGKTYTGSHLIVALLERGFSVGVSSNSHKAIHNLLHAVEQHAAERDFSFSGVKKANRSDSNTEFDGALIVNEYNTDDIDARGYHLVAGTAWLFADQKFDQALDYLFVDEAGQVSLANLVVMSLSARNIVLLGDQMQLGQPIQGVHPGRSGESALEYLLDADATVRPDRGIFLATTWRMHEHVCRFISDAVYDGRLHPEAHNQRQRLMLGADAHPALKSTGIGFLAVHHEGCSQRSVEEAETVRMLYDSLLLQSYRDREGAIHRMTSNDILIVAPYNMQVNLLKRTLPEGARVGTVDKFQGQEAEVVLISMATSSGEDLPRHLEFFYSKNRLNVAISRARCLAVVIANPELLSIRCNSVQQMRLVNTLCWIREYATCPTSGNE